MWRVLWSALLFLVLTLARSAPGFADERKEIHVSIRPQSIPPDVQKWAFRRGTKTRILDVEEGFDKATQGLIVFVYDPKAAPENNCILKEFMDQRHETAREDIHIPMEWRERCSGGGGSGRPQGAGAGAARALAQAGAVANLSSPEGEKGGSPYGVAGGMNPTAESSPELQAAVASAQIALSATEMRQIVQRATRFVVARLTKQAEIEAIEKAAVEGIEQLAKEGRAVSREAIENRAREAAAEAERAIHAGGGGGAGGAPQKGLTTVHIPRRGEPPPIRASGTPTKAGSRTGTKIPTEELKIAPTKRGNAPIGADGKPVELHHREQAPDSPLDEMTREDHRGKGNFTENHTNTGQDPSKIDRDDWKNQRSNTGRKSGTVDDSTRNEDTILRFDAPRSDLSVILEDDGNVAYAYLLEGETVVADVWLYNVAEAPASVDWSAPAGLPFLNPREYCRSEQIPRLSQSSGVSCKWQERSVEIIIDGVLVARLEHGTKPGWSRAAARPGPLAQPL